MNEIPLKIVLICSVKLLSSEVALYLWYLPYGFAWNSAVMSELLLLIAICVCGESFRNGYVGLQVLPCCFFWTLGSSSKCGLTRSFLFELLRWSFELAKQASCLYSCRIYTRYSNKLHNLSVTNRKFYKDVYVNIFFPGHIQEKKYIFSWFLWTFSHTFIKGDLECLSIIWFKNKLRHG